MPKGRRRRRAGGDRQRTEARSIARTVHAENAAAVEPASCAQRDDPDGETPQNAAFSLQIVTCTRSTARADQIRRVAPSTRVTLVEPAKMPMFPTSRRAAVSLEARVRAAVDAHYDGVWRFLRRFGVAEAEAEDAAQKVFVVFAERLASIEPRAEKSFLFSSAVRVASDARKKRARSREELANPGESVEPSDPAPSAEDQIDDRRRRRWLDQVLGDLSDEHRAVLVLVDVEGHTMADASEALGIPQGTVASRLRRARELFEAGAKELKERLQNEARGES